MIMKTLIGAFHDTANDVDKILEWCYPMPKAGRYREANFTTFFVQHVTRRLNGGAYPIRSCESDAFAYFEAPIRNNADFEAEDGRVDAVIADWKSSSFIAVECKGSYTAQGGEIAHQVDRLMQVEARRKLMHNFDWPERSDPVSFWLVILCGYWGKVPEDLVPVDWREKFKNCKNTGRSYSCYLPLKLRTDMKEFGLLFNCSLIDRHGWVPRP